MNTFNIENGAQALLDLPGLFSSVWLSSIGTLDLLNPTRFNTFSEDYLLAGVQAGEVVQIDLTGEIDPYIQLIDASTGSVLRFDDDGGVGTDARLQFTVQAGVDYLVRATTFNEAETGDFRLSVSQGLLTPAAYLAVGESAQGFLSNTDSSAQYRSGSFNDSYFLSGLENYQQVTLDIESAEFDTYLQLIDANTGGLIAFNDDGGFGTNSNLSFIAQPDADYLLHVTSYGESEQGNYTLFSTATTLDNATLLIENDPLFGSALSPSSLNSQINGFGNNLENPDLGTAGSVLRDSTPLQYADGFSTPAGQNRPNARVISNAISQQAGDQPEPRGLTNLIWAWGQFLDHDISLSPEEPGEEATVVIPVPVNDPALMPGNVISLQDTAFEEGTGTGPNNPRLLPNEITTWVDGSNVYGSDAERLDALRAFSGGQLLVSDGNLLPTIDPNNGLPNDNPRAPRELFIAGDVRANENSVLTSVHTLFVREHNRLAGELAAAHPDWDDERIFQRARQINIAQMQNITFNEYLPTLSGRELADYEGYDASVDPSIERVFSTAAFRLGHTQLSSTVARLDANGNSTGDLTLSDIFFPGVDLLQEAGIGDILRGVASTLSQEVDNEIIEDVRSLLFGGSPNAPARDLVALNIERGRLNGVADYNTVRESYGLARVTSFADITSDVDRQQTLESLYGSVDNIDAFVGFLAEDTQPGSSLGQSLIVVLQDQFVRLRDGDRFYFENTFSTPEIAAIQATSFSDIIRRNTDTTVIQDTAFTLINEGTDGADTLNGGLGEDTISGGGGADTIFGEAADDFLFGNGGNDTLYGDGGDDFLVGEAGSDRLLGGFGNDSLFGEGGNDDLLGGAGDDFLFGTTAEVNRPGEIDILTGGGGADIFVLGDADGIYYDDGLSNQSGTSDYAYLSDFDRTEDIIALHGSSQQYQITSAGDIFYTSGGNELIATLGTSSAGLSLNSNAFVYL